MARVSIEERAAAAAKKLAKAMGWTRAKAIGSLYLFWHDSQELEQTHCTIEDISLWMDLDADEESTIGAAMTAAGFIAPCEDGYYLICGNEKHIENLRQHRESAKLGGIRSAQSRAAKLKLVSEATASTETKRPLQATASTESQVPVEVSSLQFSAVQFSAREEENIYKPAAPTKIPPEETDACRKAWLDTLKHFKIDRPLSADEERTIYQLIKQHGYKFAAYGLAGMRFEEKTRDYDPGKNVSIHRALDTAKFNKFVNLAAQKKGMA
jgi:hypothetical protein